MTTLRLGLLVAAAGLAALVGLDAVVRDAPVPEDDDLIYELMARDPTAPHTFVFAYRILPPWLVHVLPLSTTAGFSVLAWLASAATAGVLVVLIERFSVPRRISVPLALFVAVSPTLLVASLRQGRNPDPITLLVLVTGALCIVDRRPRALAATMLAGALNRESALFLAPFAYAIWAARPVDRAVLGRVALVAAPAVVAFVALRLAIPVVGRYPGSAVGGRLDLLRDAAGMLDVQARRVATVFGPLWLLAPLALRDLPYARRGLVLVALCVLAGAFALDWGRIAALLVPVVVPAAAWVLARRPRLVAPTFALLALLVVGYAAYMQVAGMDRLIEAGPPPYPVR